MKIFLLVHNLDKTTSEIIERININVLENKCSILDLKYFDFKKSEINKENYFLIFGEKPLKIFNSIFDKKVEVLPNIFILEDISSLIPKEKNKEIRQKTFGELLEIKKKINNKTIINKDILPDLTSSDIMILEKILREQNRDNWVGKLPNGKTIRISTKVDKENKEDILFTFAELYCIKVTMETLNLGEFQIVPSCKNNS